jgi:adenosylmethionine-8-amino-7-oxononanoate aminotransferase
MTGFHRTGPLFAFEHAGIAPDLVCLSKGLTGGFLPLSVTLATDEIFQAFESRDLSQAFLHGHSYTGNPTACAAALASWELLQKPGTQTRIREISALTAERISRIREKGLGKNPRSLGTLGAVEHPAGAAYGSDLSRKLYAAALESGVLIRPLGSTLYLLPPYCSSDPELHQAWDVLESLLQNF